MKRFAVAGCLLAVTLAGVALADEKALKELEGSYTVTALEKGGKAAPKEVMDGLKVSIKGDALTITVAGEEKKAKIKLDGSKSPATIDILPSDGPEKGKTFPGIYKVEKGEVTIVFQEKDTGRPKEFKSEGETMLMKMKKAEEKK